MGEVGLGDGKSKGTIAIVSQKYPPEKGGGASRNSEMGEFLNKEAWEVIVLTPPSAYPYGNFRKSWKWRDCVNKNGVEVNYLWSWQPGSEDPSLLSRLLYHITFAFHSLCWLGVHRRRVDIILTSSPPIFTGIAGIAAIFSRNTRWVVDVRDLWIDVAVDLGFISDSSIAKKLSEFFERLVLGNADLISVTTETLGSELESKYSISKSKITVVPNGVNTTTFYPRSYEKEYPIVYVGNLGHAKRLDSVIRAMSIIDDDDITLHFIGGGDSKLRCQNLVNELNLENTVFFEDPVPHDEVPNILNRSKLGIVSLKKSPSLNYCTPIKIYEYMACELPVIGTDMPGIASVIKEAECGITVDNQPEDIAQSIELLLEDAPKRNRMGKNGRSWVVPNYDRGFIANQFDKELTTLLSR